MLRSGPFVNNFEAFGPCEAGLAAVGPLVGDEPMPEGGIFGIVALAAVMSGGSMSTDELLVTVDAIGSVEVEGGVTVLATEFEEGATASTTPVSFAFECDCPADKFIDAAGAAALLVERGVPMLAGGT